ncbi:MAG: hypothetical protein QW327_03835 [Candidatus Odinarchaeota archaeon]
MERLREAIENAINVEAKTEKHAGEECLGDFIEGVYIFDVNGLLVYSKNFNSNEVDPALVSGFFSAIQTFTNTMISERDMLQEITLQERKFIFKLISDSDLVIMISTRKNMEWESRKILDKISSDINYVLKNTNLTVKMLNSFLNIYVEKLLPRQIFNT